jgi:purine-binding chemotaxis protein CheW
LEPSPLQRALAASPDRPLPQVPAVENEYFVFRGGTHHYAVRSSHIREVCRVRVLTPLPRAPASILGAMAHRGEVFPVVDLFRFLSRGQTVHNDRARLMVSQNDGRVVGFLVEQVVGLRRFLASAKMPTPSNDVGWEFVDGIISADKWGILTVLNLVKVVDALQERVVKR